MNKLWLFPIFLVLLAGIGLSLTNNHVHLIAPTDTSAYWNDSTNDTQYFTFNYSNSDNDNANCTLFINNVKSTENISVANNTNVAWRINVTLAERYHYWTVDCYNRTGTNGTNDTAPVEYFWIDRTAPNVTTTFSMNSEIATNTIIVYYACTDNLLNSSPLRVKFNASNYTQTGYTKTVNVTNATTYNATLLGLLDGDNTFNISCEDNVSIASINITQHISQMFGINYSIDNTAPVFTNITSINTSSATSSYITYMWNITDNHTGNGSDANSYNITGCFAKLYASAGTTPVYNLTGTYYNVSQTGKVRGCGLNITASDFYGIGSFKVTLVANDTRGNTRYYAFNMSNNTRTDLYTYWNLIASHQNTTLQEIANYSPAITTVSRYSNTNHTYTTYTVGTVTNENVSIYDGDAVYVRVTSNVSLLRLVNKDTTWYNVSLTSGWNQMTTFNSTSLTLKQLNQSNRLENRSGEALAIRYLSFYNSSANYYWSYACRLTINENKTVAPGYGVWVHLNGTGNHSWLNQTMTVW